MKKWKTESGSVVLASEEISLPDQYIHRLFEQGQEVEGSGRGKTRRGSLTSGESFVLRTYYRGGAARQFSEKSFLNLPTSPYRPFIELQILEDLFSQGVKVPRPLFAVVNFGFLNLSYSGVIATEEIVGAHNLEHWPEGEGCEFLAEEAGREALKALEAGVLHRDLHPGNVLVKPAGGIVLIDFDRALRVRPGDSKRYGAKLIERWERYVLKNRLGEDLIRGFCRGVTT